MNCIKIIGATTEGVVLQRRKGRWWIIITIRRKIVDILLSIQYKEKYGGLHREDSVWAVDDNSKCVLNMLMIIDFENEKPEDIFDTIKQKMYNEFFKDTNVLPKLSNLKKKAYGYGFYTKGEYKVDDCVRRSEFQVNVDQKEYVDEDDIQQFVSFNSNRDLPLGNSALWEVLVSTRPAKWRGKNGRYPILLRMHHCLGDGITIFMVMFNRFIDQVPKGVDDLAELQKIEAKIPKIPKIFRIWSVLNAFFHAPGHVFLQGMVSKDETILQVPHELSGEKIAVWAIADQENKTVTQIKQMRKKINGIFFTDVILSALSTSLAEYFESLKCENIPPTLNVTMPFKFMLNIVPKDGKNVILPKLANTFSFASTTIPTGHICSPKPMLSRLKRVHTELSLLQNSPQLQINHWVMKICEILPLPLLVPMVHSGQKCSVTFSNMPGPARNTFNGHSIDNIIFWTAHRASMGFAASILTFDEKIQMALLVDKSLIPSKDDCQRILDNVLENIQRLDEEIERI